MKMPFSVLLPFDAELETEPYETSVVHTLYIGTEGRLSNPAFVVHSREMRMPTVHLLCTQSDHLCTCLI